MKHAAHNPLPTLEVISSASLAVLRTCYAQVMDTPPRSGISAEILRGNLAWAIQALAQGRDPVEVRASLLKTAKESAARSTACYKPGTRLVREWQGQTHEVTILENGFLWQNRRYRSLSQIAEAITGTRWSGPRFFGSPKS